MKIAIMGYSGSGKSTLARELAEIYHTDVLHFDAIQFLPNWEVRNDEEKKRMTQEFMDTHESWIIDGNYSKLFYERRMEEADVIVLLLFGRFDCLQRAYCRYLRYKNTTRPDMAEGCNEKFDFEFIKWILWEGRSKRARKRYANVISQYPKKTVVIKNQKQLDSYRKSLTDTKAYVTEE
ncbi:MAG: DNA topology modulation protein [Ruminococcaceae bacterium]|nr:DNA topology modulation protein [Oscillospiraceae bacterium]